MIDAPRIAEAFTVYQAWDACDDEWVGAGLYLTEDTARAAAAHEYARVEYEDADPGDVFAARPLITWVHAHGRWNLLDHGMATTIYVVPATIWREATDCEVKQQDALAAQQRT